jgi:hypothetical protein
MVVRPRRIPGSAMPRGSMIASTRNVHKTHGQRKLLKYNVNYVPKSATEHGPQYGGLRNN